MVDRICCLNLTKYQKHLAVTELKPSLDQNRHAPNVCVTAKTSGVGRDDESHVRRRC